MQYLYVYTHINTVHIYIYVYTHTHIVVLENTLRVLWKARRRNQSILKEISPEYSLEGLMLKLQYFGHLRRRADSVEKTLMLAKIEGKQRQGWQRMRWLEHHQLSEHEFEQIPGGSKGQGSLACCSPWGRRELDMT